MFYKQKKNNINTYALNKVNGPNLKNNKGMCEFMYEVVQFAKE